MSENGEISSGVSRRTVTKAMAWAVPAIAVAAPVPAFAASGGPPTITPGPALKWPGASCKNTPGVPAGLDENKAYVFTFKVQNLTNSTIYIYGATITTNSSITFNVVGATPAFGSPIAPGAVVCLYVWANSNDSGNLVFDAHASISWGHNFPGPDPDGHAPVVKDWHVPGTPTPTSAGLGQCSLPPC